MAIAFAIFGLAFAAFCVWLTVRIINRRKKPGVAFWATVMVVVVLLYVLSVGPVIWLSSRAMLPQWTHAPINAFYAPLLRAWEASPRGLDTWLWYTDFWNRKGPPQPSP